MTTINMQTDHQSTLALDILHGTFNTIYLIERIPNMGMIDGGALNFGVLCKCQDLLLSCCQGNEWPTHGSETLPV